MKCLCGYIYEEGINPKNDKWGILIGDKPFIEIKGHFTRQTDDYFPQLEEIETKWNNYKPP